MGNTFEAQGDALFERAAWCVGRSAVGDGVEPPLTGHRRLEVKVSGVAIRGGKRNQLLLLENGVGEVGGYFEEAHFGENAVGGGDLGFGGVEDAPCCLYSLKYWVSRPSLVLVISISSRKVVGSK